MTKLMEGRTSFVIAHRLSTILDADRIWSSTKVRLLSREPAELLAQNGFYAELYSSQFVAATA